MRFKLEGGLRLPTFWELSLQVLSFRSIFITVITPAYNYHGFYFVSSKVYFGLLARPIKVPDQLKRS